MKLRNILLSVLFAATFCACTDFGNINVDPNSVSAAKTDYLFTYAARYTRYFVQNSDGYDPWTVYWNGYGAESINNQYGPLGTTAQYSTSSYYLYAIKNLQYVIDMASAENPGTNVTSFGDVKSQIGAASTLQAFFYLKMTDILGPIVYSEALKGSSDDNWKPKYDSVKDVYYGLFKQLNEAYTTIPADGSLNSNDLFYNGNMKNWKKLNASIRMLMAIRLSDIDPAKGKEEFAKAYSDGGIVKNAENFQYTFDNLTPNTMYSQIYLVGSPSQTSMVPNSQIVDTLKAYQDKRLFEYCDVQGYKAPVTDEAGELLPENDFNSYKGVPHGLRTNDDVSNASKGCCSFDKKLYESMTIPQVLINAAVVLFAQAEAAELGWISATPKTLYEDAIKASFEQWGAADVDKYIASAKVAFSSNKDQALYQIHLQRWIAAFFTDGIEAWADWRRTDVPFRPVGPGALDASNNAYPYRLLYYPDTDVKYNEENYKACLKDLSDGKDTRWSRLWWDVKDNRTGVYPVAN
ncbi:MAG: SusD/RagB family nutrient-binding outer membrane lipoprotein [Bacteroidales bacterium]|nr:SusD/RagB family nutrient-binding outer membrane lipoprotein [Bacteroidales bacterium]